MSYENTSKRMKEKWQDPQWRESMIQRLRLRKGKKIKGRSEESKKRTSEAIKKWHQEMPPEKKEARNKKLSEGILNLSEEKKQERKDKLSKGNKEAYTKDLTLSERLSISLKEAAKREDVKKKRSEAAKKYFQSLTEEQKAERSRKLKEYSARPEVKAQRSESRKRFNKEHPGRYNKSEEHKRKISESVSRGILNGNKNGYFKSSKRGYHLSPKVGKVYYRSAYELKSFELLDADPKVKSYLHDAYRIPYNSKGNKRYFIIDLTIEYTDGSRKYVEVKPKDFLSDSEVLEKIKAAKTQLGNLFEVWSEKELQIEDPTKLYR